MTLSHRVNGSHRFEGTYCLHLQKTAKSWKNSSGPNCPVTQRQIREDRNLRLHRLENLKTRKAHELNWINKIIFSVDNKTVLTSTFPQFVFCQNSFLGVSLPNLINSYKESVWKTRLSVNRWCICTGLIVEITGRIGRHVTEILANVTRGFFLLCMTSCAHIVIMTDLVTTVIHDRVLKFDKAHTTRIKLQTYFVTDSNRLCTCQ